MCVCVVVYTVGWHEEGAKPGFAERNTASLYNPKRLSVSVTYDMSTVHRPWVEFYLTIIPYSLSLATFFLGGGGFPKYIQYKKKLPDERGPEQIFSTTDVSYV